MIIPYNDEKTWDLVCSGRTHGIFQCESRLVQSMLKRIQPRNIWELSLVICLCRPGCLQNGMYEQYLANKDSQSFKTFNNPIIDKIFSTTNGVLCFQEQLMYLGAKLAWPHIPERERLILVDDLRKAVGKKNQQKILEIGNKFVEGCLFNNVEQELANNLFEIIKNCGRYLFNLSHSIKYADIGYKTAWLKTHYPLEFYSTYLTYAEEKQDKFEEINKFVDEGRLFDIEFVGPNINDKNIDFAIMPNKSIQYGLRHLKHYHANLNNYLENLPILDKWQKVIIFLMSDTFGIKVRTNTAIALISTGCFRDCGISRRALLSIYDVLNELSKKELEYILENIHTCTSIKELPALIENCANEIALAKRTDKILSQLKFLDLSLFDDPAWIEQMEKKYMGTALTATSLDKKLTDFANKVIECHGTFPDYETRKIAVIIDEVRHTVTKKGTNPGQKMAIISVHDDSAKLERIPVFPDLYTERSEFLIENNTVILEIYCKNNNWIIKEIWQL